MAWNSAIIGAWRSEPPAAHEEPAARRRPTAAEIDAIILAGAFGSFIDPVSAIRIGRLPRVDPMCIEQVGNAAGVVAKEVLISRAQREAAEALARSIQVLELTVYPRYSHFFAHGMRF